MLVNLHVRNLALIRDEEVEFGPGLNILTGETGAGKSMIIGSVGIALGAENFRDYVTEGEENALVELIFHTTQEQAAMLLEQADIPAEEGMITLSRKWQNGRTVNRINGESVPLKMIREMAALLLDIHGQHEHQSLLHERYHRELLDGYGASSYGDILARYRSVFRQYQKKREETAAAMADSSDRLKRADMLSYEVREIEEAHLSVGEDEALERDYTRMASAQKITETLSQAALLAGGDSEVSEQLGRGVRTLGTIASLDTALGELAGMLEEVEVLHADFVRALDRYRDDFFYDEETFDQMSRRLDLINHLKSRYGKTIEDILSYLEKDREELERLENYDLWLAQQKAEEEKLYQEALALAKAIMGKREEAADALEKEITSSLQELNFPQVRFAIPVREAPELNINGKDEVSFLISTNPGMPLRNLSQVASGGELSRIMLAVKSVMADQDSVETLIFDEIDTGISGRTAQKVSEKMAVIAKSHQVICITHLAQIAAMADRHYEIVKSVEEGQTHTHVHLLDTQQSVRELARILGGVSITDAVIASAKEMKQLAQSVKAGRESSLPKGS